jgi:hypothetical protein
LDLLVEADTEGTVQESVFFAVAHLLNEVYGVDALAGGDLPDRLYCAET